jgi:hypothetical protein
MAQERIILAIGRIEMALSRIERAKLTEQSDSDLRTKHEKLKAETRSAIAEIDNLLKSGER